MTVYHLVVIFSLFVAALAQMSLKKAATVHYDSLWREYLNVWVIGGYALMFLSMAIDIWAVSKGVLVKELSTMESCSYLIVPLFGMLFFRERLAPRKFIGIAVILAGVVVFFI